MIVNQFVCPNHFCAGAGKESRRVLFGAPDRKYLSYGARRCNIIYVYAFLPSLLLCTPYFPPPVTQSFAPRTDGRIFVFSGCEGGSYFSNNGLFP